MLIRSRKQLSNAAEVLTCRIACNAKTAHARFSTHRNSSPTIFAARAPECQGRLPRTCSPAGACSIVIASLQRKGQKSEVGKKTLRVSTPRNSSPTIFARFSRPRNSSPPEFESHDIARVSTSRNSSPTTFARFSTAVLEARAGPI